MTARDGEAIALEKVSVLRNGSYLLRDVDWAVARNERWVLLGPNGAGKTTMLQVASTYLAPSLGTVRLLGRARGSFDVRELRTRVGYAGAGPATYVRPGLPAVEIVVTGKHAAFVDSRWHEYDDGDWHEASQRLAQLGAEHLADQPFGTLSAGERQRVLIARSLMTDPELLLLDEATTGLDLGAREQMVSSLAALATDPQAPACVLVTHHVEEIPPAFSHIALLRGGEIIATGAIDETLTSDALTTLFGVDLELEHREGRYHAWRPK